VVVGCRQRLGFRWWWWIRVLAQEGWCFVMAVQEECGFVRRTMSARSKALITKMLGTQTQLHLKAGEESLLTCDR
jgi:hypothetical protein